MKLFTDWLRDTRPFRPFSKHPEFLNAVRFIQEDDRELSPDQAATAITHGERSVQLMREQFHRLDDKANGLLRVSGGVTVLATLIAQSEQLSFVGWEKLFFTMTLLSLVVSAVCTLAAKGPTAIPLVVDMHRVIEAATKYSQDQLPNRRAHSLWVEMRAWETVCRFKANWVFLAHLALVVSMVCAILLVIA